MNRHRRSGRTSRRAGLMSSFAACLALAGPLAWPAAAADPPRRIVSLNLCTDQILLDLVPRDRIAALSELVADPALSGRVAAAEGLPLVRGHAEEVLALAPDLVIAGEYSTPVTVDLLRRLGVRVVQVPLAFDFAGIRKAVRAVAEAAGVTAEGEAMVARFDQRLAAARAFGGGDRGVDSATPHSKNPDAPRPSAVVFHVNSLASGTGSLLDEIVRAAGYRNAAHSMRLGPA
ncbi:MAG: ABC transporter substrate-binding protein, partial [Hyphomicrobium sp.]